MYQMFISEVAMGSQGKQRCSVSSADGNVPETYRCLCSVLALLSLGISVAVCAADAH